jgi:hypothetical protein
MEKTKHLTLSREESEQQKQKEAGQRIKGLIQKFQDKVLDQEKLANELDSLKATYGAMISGIMLDALLDGLDLNRKNDAQLFLLHEVCAQDTAGLASVLSGFRDDIQLMTRERVKTLEDLLAEKRSISGSAVVPNVEMDKVWHAHVLEIKDKFDALLEREKTAIKRYYGE